MAGSSFGSGAGSTTPSLRKYAAANGPIGFPTGDSARVSTHWMPSVVHSSVQPASTCDPATLTHRVTDGANAISNAASKASCSIGLRKACERITP